MNDYRFLDLRLGQKAHFVRLITPEMLDEFQNLSGDDNPLHTEKEFALRQGHKDRVVHGLLAASLYSALVGVHLPGRYALLHEINVQFLRPVYPGDTLTVEGTVSHLHESYRRVEILATSTNQEGTRTSKAKIQVGLLE